MILRLVSLGMAVLVSITGTGCGSEEEPSVPRTQGRDVAPPTILASVIEARTVSVPLTVEVTGKVVARFQATLSSKVQGTVQELRVREGAAVSKGQTLVVLESRDLRADLAKAEAEVDNARTHLARMKGLFAKDSVARQEFDNARRAFKVAQAVRDAAQAQLSYTVIKAPFTSVITERLVEVGELASTGQPLLKIEDPGRLQLEATVGERDVKDVSKGDTITVVIDALEATPLEGKVVRVLPAGDPTTHTFLVKVALPPTPGLKSSMFGRMQLQKGVSRTILVPKAAVIERSQLTGLYVLGEDDRAYLRWIKVGRTLGNDLEVISGLNPGERLLADAAQGRDGARVEVIETTAQSSIP